MRKTEDLKGKRFGQLVVIELSKEKSSDGSHKWVCQCDCGQRTVVKIGNLKNGHTKSCGCYRNQFSKTKKSLNHRLYSIWKNMKSRCNNPNNTNYKNYGSRGIEVCSEWNDFDSFFDWATTNGYSDELTLDRIDPNKNYEPSNCRWANNFVQQRNKRNNRNITYKGETHCLSDWAKILGVNYKTLSYRLAHKSIEEILG